jgi:hypothetical protein
VNIVKRRTFAAIPTMLLLPVPEVVETVQRELAPGAAATDGTAAVQATTVESPGVVAGNLPAFFEQLRNELDFPLAWGTSPVRNFRRWQRSARATVEELLCQPTDSTPFQAQVVDEVDAARYTQRIIEFNVTRHSRVRATMLVPHGRGPFPAALLLHDHGSKFDIGKEKVIRPWYDEARLSSAQAWSARFFSDRFLGNELVARGYAVLAVDALGWGDRGGLTYENQQALASNLGLLHR